MQDRNSSLPLPPRYRDLESLPGAGHVVDVLQWFSLNVSPSEPRSSLALRREFRRKMWHCHLVFPWSMVSQSFGSHLIDSLK